MGDHESPSKSRQPAARGHEVFDNLRGTIAAEFPDVIHTPHRPIANHRHFTKKGEYAGRAIFRPHHRRDLKDGLFQAIGCTVELEFAGVASPEEPFGGQNLYQERRGELLQHSWVPEEDLEFIDEPTAPPSGGLL
jgi:hypothetical protein